MQKELIAQDVSFFFWTVVASGNMDSPGGCTCIQRSVVKVILQSCLDHHSIAMVNQPQENPNLFKTDRSRTLFKLFDFVCDHRK